MHHPTHRIAHPTAFVTPLLHRGRLNIHMACFGRSTKPEVIDRGALNIGRDANPVPTSPLTDDIVSAPKGPIKYTYVMFRQINQTRGYWPRSFERSAEDRSRCEPSTFQSTLADESSGRKEIFHLTTHSTHFIYDYMASDLW